MLLSDLSHPNQLKGLSVSELEEIACQIRERHLQVVSTSGGHLGPGLGVVELTLALYQTLDLDFDKVVWDVGHQAYPHKLITGRFNDFDTLRQEKGIAGYLKRSESKFDHFGAGHASTSISAALGMAIARDTKGEDYKCVAVIGDGALTGGMALEAINHAGHLPNTPFLVILNDNDMSISPPVGALSTYLNRVRLSPPLQFLSDSVQESVKNIPIIGKDIPEELKTIQGSVRRLAVPKVGAVFEELGFTYMGPIDGHDITNLMNTFNAAHRLKKPVLVHVVTTKGKGYPYAEADQVGYHAQSSFDLTTGKSIPSSKPKPSSYSKIFGQTLLKICEQDSKVFGITAAMATGTGLDILQKNIPNQYIDVGIAEQHAVTFSAGMATSGLIPFCNIYSSFMQRAYDQVIHDVALQKLHVIFCLDRAGVAGADGPTHHGAYDIAYMRCIPNMIVAAPMNEEELRNMMFTAQVENNGPFTIRYPRGQGVMPQWKTPFKKIKIGEGRKVKSGDDIAILSIGHIGNYALKAAQELESANVSAAHYDMRFAKPVDELLLYEVFSKFDKVITVEDGCIVGGMGSAVLEFMADHNYQAQVKRLGIPDKVIEHGSQDELYAECNYDTASIVKTAKEMLSERSNPSSEKATA